MLTPVLDVDELRTVELHDGPHGLQPLTVSIHIHGDPGEAIAAIRVDGPWQGWSVAMAASELHEVRDAINAALAATDA